jgi:glycosyltransferase involved in cell wall biosynthesis
MARLAGPVAAELALPSIGHLRDIVGLSAAAVADLNRNTRLLAVSRATRAFHLPQGVAEDRTFVLYNGVDLERFSPMRTRPSGPPLPPGEGGRRPGEGEPIKREDPHPNPLPKGEGTDDSPRRAESLLDLNLPRDAQLLGCIGQIIQRKGQDLLLPLAHRLRRELPHAQLWIVGDCPSQKDEAIAFERRVRRELSHAAPGQVHFLGRRDDVPEILQQLSILVHPARQEPLGRVLLEAAASGVPIVATEVGGTAEIFPPEADAAILVPAGDAKQLAEAAMRLLRDTERRSQLGRAARHRAEAVFDARTSAAGLAQHYAAVLG